MNLRNISLFLILHLVIACKVSDRSFDKGDFRNIKIPITDEQQIYYSLIAYEGDYFVGFNRARNSFDFFDLRENKFSHSVKLAYDGPQSIGNIQDFNYSAGYLYVFDNLKGVYKVDSNGHLKSHFSFKDKLPAFLNFHGGMYIAPPQKTSIQNGRLYFALFPQMARKSIEYNKYFYFGSLSLDLADFQLIQLEGPEAFQDPMGYWPFHDTHFITILRDSIYANFKPLSDIYLFENGKLKKRISNDFQNSGILTQAEKVLRMLSERDAMMKKGAEQTLFGGVAYYSLKYDEQSNCFYQLVKGKSEVDEKTPIHDAIYGAENYLLVYNDEFELLRIIKCPKGFIRDFVIYDSKIYGLKSEEMLESEDALEFFVIDAGL